MKAFDTIYPGGMKPCKDGTYVERDDAASLLEALAECIKARDHWIEDQDALNAQLKADLEAACKQREQTIDDLREQLRVALDGERAR